MAEGKVCEREQAGRRGRKAKRYVCISSGKAKHLCKNSEKNFFQYGLCDPLAQQNMDVKMAGTLESTKYKRCVRLIKYLHIQVLNALFICNQLIFNETKFYLMKIQSLQQRVDSIATLSSQNKTFLTASGSTCDICFSLQQGLKQSLMETNLLKGVNESPNCWSMQDLLKHNAPPEGSFSARTVMNISNKPKLLLLGAEERITLMVYLIKP